MSLLRRWPVWWPVACGVEQDALVTHARLACARLLPRSRGRRRAAHAL